ncbi:hypothetical protein DY000_02039275 [Brassica cretica]|nr:hypothetical protein DY000_02039275 [Brassica cretica]
MYERRTKRRFDVGGSSTALPPSPVRDQDPRHANAKTNPYRSLTVSMTRAKQRRA